MDVDQCYERQISFAISYKQNISISRKQVTS